MFNLYGARLGSLADVIPDGQKIDAFWNTFMSPEDRAMFQTQDQIDSFNRSVLKDEGLVLLSSLRQAQNVLANKGGNRTVIEKPSQIPGIIASLANAFGNVFTANQQAKLQSQLLSAQRNRMPVYLPQTSSWGTAAVVVGALALVVVGAIVLTGGKKKTAV